MDTLMKAWGLALVLSSIASSQASAGPPEPSRCSMPPAITVVGTALGVPDPRGTFAITIRDAAGTPCPSVPVTLRFHRCTDLRLSLLQAPGATLNCANATVTAFTTAAGVATFTIIGAGNLPCNVPFVDRPGPELGNACVGVCADGVFLGNMLAAYFDLNGAATTGADGIGPIEALEIRSEINGIALGAQAHERIDYNFSGSINGADLAIWLNEAFRPAALGGGSRQGSNGSGYCAAPATQFTCP